MQREDKTFTIVASRSHMSAETESMCKKCETSRRSEFNLKRKLFKTLYGGRRYCNCYPRFAPTMEWDTAAGQGICEHAGFQVLDWDTKKIMLYNREELLNNWFLVK